MTQQILPSWNPPENAKHPFFDEPPIIYPPRPAQNCGNMSRKSQAWPELVAQLKDLYWREGKTPKELAQQFKISRSSVGRYIGIYSYDEPKFIYQK
tara:strand:- start:2838 stop:3125 length:288 start_codon:yes stop_codon:yes gene_type:complete